MKDSDIVVGKPIIETMRDNKKMVDYVYTENYIRLLDKMKRELIIENFVRFREVADIFSERKIDMPPTLENVAIVSKSTILTDEEISNYAHNMWVIKQNALNQLHQYILSCIRKESE